MTESLSNRPTKKHGVEKHLTIDDLAERVNVPRMTVERWNSRGGGPAYIRVGRHVRYRLAEVLRWEESRLVQPKDTPEDGRRKPRAQSQAV